MHFTTAFYVNYKGPTNFHYNLTLSFVLTLGSFNRFQKLTIFVILNSKQLICIPIDCSAFIPLVLILLGFTMKGSL